MDGTEHPAPGSAGGRSGVGEGKESGRGVAEAQWADLPLDRQVALLQADIEGWRRRVECLEATLDTARNSAGEDIRLLDELRRQRDYARAELDVTGAAFEALRNAHHIPYADEDHQGGNCADIVIGLVAARMKVESSRRAWAEEAARLQAELDDYTQPAMWDEPHAFRDNGYGDPELGTPGNCDTCGSIQDEPLHEPPFGPLRLRPAVNAPCSCISDTQAASLGPGFTRPVCAVHPKEST